MGEITANGENESRDIVVLTKEVLDSDGLMEKVRGGSGEYGAVSTFVGVTRDTFQGKRVMRLEYEAYEKMARAELKKLSEKVRETWNGVGRMYVAHRLGIVPVGEASVVIAVSSKHRKDALQGCAMAIELLKERVPIWKREVYEDGSEWKQNREFKCGGKR
eukprot:Plantae.Rhodophyta-Hildenbrandia_rubra.ctg15542.p1 GENE.Plantae.Rhodophyta-Hildenbrandia_rubra.ctg15542~~Plantae.Rhodophyta-Hildenbrandia_rubra.ctg15542.p1  ORF type:complete len:161 (-),score=40.33 Plantae.Rhodophyta-Hildenbrandia_rubra.ctg15542:868-1350(-)